MLLPNFEDLSDRPNRLPISFSGWSLRIIAGLEPELLQFLLFASPLRRQAVFLIVAVGDLVAFADRCRGECPDEDWRDVVSHDISLVLRKWRVQRLLAILCSINVPRGLMGVLMRAGHAPLARRSYQTLLDVLTAGGTRAQFLIDAPNANDLSVETASRLDLALCRAGILNAIHSVELVTGINAVARIAREFAGAYDEDLRQSVSPPPRSWSRWATRWAEKAKSFPAAPKVPEGFTGLNSAAALKDAAMRYSNCLVTRIPGAVVGRRAYAEYGPGEAMIELAALCDDKWQVLNVHGPDNDPVDPMTVREIVTKLKAAGFAIPIRFHDTRETRAAARLLGVYDFEETARDPILAEMLDDVRWLAEADA